MKALIVGLVASGLVVLQGCAVATSDDPATSGESAQTAARVFQTTAPWQCNAVDPSTLARLPRPSPGNVEVTVKFKDDPVPYAQIAPIVASRPPSKYRVYGKVQAGEVDVQVSRPALDGTPAPVSSKFKIANFVGSVNADAEGFEAPYRLFYEIDGDPQLDAAAPQGAFADGTALVLYNIGSAGRSFTMVLSAIYDDAQGDRIECRARKAFADPATGQMPGVPAPLPADDAGAEDADAGAPDADAGAPDADAGPDPAAWPF